MTRLAGQSSPVNQIYIVFSFDISKGSLSGCIDASMLAIAALTSRVQYHAA